MDYTEFRPETVSDFNGILALSPTEELVARCSSIGLAGLTPFVFPAYSSVYAGGVCAFAGNAMPQLNCAASRGKFLAENRGEGGIKTTLRKERLPCKKRETRADAWLAKKVHRARRVLLDYGCPSSGILRQKAA